MSEIIKILPTLTLSILFLVGGLYMIIDDLVFVGTSSRNLGTTAVGGYLLVFIGLIFLVITYFNLSPFGKIRRFIEGGSNKKNKYKSDSKK